MYQRWGAIAKVSIHGLQFEPQSNGGVSVPTYRDLRELAEAEEEMRHTIAIASDRPYDRTPESVQELSKGKTTTMPSRHTGEGIFFSSKAANRFEIESGALRRIIDNRKNDMAVGTLEPAVLGTTVRAEIDSDNARDRTSVFAEYTRDFEFSRTRTIVRLFSIGSEFLSRSQAKRLVRGLEKFREVVLDFEGVNLVGLGFADEVFRVWAHQHPEIRLSPTEMSEPIAFMIERAIRGRAERGVTLAGPAPISCERKRGQVG